MSPVTMIPFASPSALDAVEEARAALVAEVDAADVGEHLGQVADDATVASHFFACTRAGYLGWRWSVTVVRVDDGPVTIDEVVLIPGDEAIIAPPWVPYRERIKPGDLSPGDLLPVSDDDPRLVPTYLYGRTGSVPGLDDDAKAQVRLVAQDLGLGRVRTLSLEGIDAAAERWYDGEAGPKSTLAQNAPHHCHSCGFMLRIAGHLADSFGVCANGDANDDGRVVAFNHGCGAHSEVRLAKKYEPIPVPEPVFDTVTVDELDSF